MNLLLKIVEGPMKGAEIALVAGTRLKVGRGDDCDIVLADASLPEFAFELDVSETGVTLVRATGEMVTMRPFEIQDFGTTAVAIGPAEGAWEPLVRPEPVSEAEEIPAVPTETVPETKSSVESEEPVEEPKKRRGCLLVLVGAFVLLLGLLAAVWFLWGRNVDWRHFNLAEEQARIKARVFGDTANASSKTNVKTRPEAPAVNLTLLVKQHGLALTETNGVKTLSGNLQHRAERLALRALVLADNPQVRLNLTDDETMNAAANETLLACSDGAIKAVSSSNCVVKLEGFAPSPDALERVLRALDADVRGVKKIDTTQVAVGGTAPAPVAETPFVKEIEPSVAVPLPVRTTRTNRRPTKHDYPIAGILTVPFPCVIMRDGSRLTEGAQIGGATLEKIEADHLVLREGGRTIEWRP